MFIITCVLQFVLWIWFFGCITTYRIRNRILVGGMGIKSAEFVMLCLFSFGLVCYHCFHSIGKWILLVILLVWFIVQFFCHWYYTIFGASQEKLKGYNECFQNTIRVIPASDKRLIPDLYHIVLHIFILLNIICCLTDYVK